MPSPGLLHLRERQPFTVYASHACAGGARRQSDLRRAGAGLRRPPGSAARPVVRAAVISTAAASGLEVELFDVPGKVALYLEGGRDTDLAGQPGDTVGVEIRAGERRLLYIPGCARMTDALRRRLSGASVVLFDGTLWRDDEMVALGLGRKTGQRMGHMSVSGPDGVVAAFRDIPVKRRILIHINNSNPILLERFGRARRRREGRLGSGLRRHGGQSMNADLGSDRLLRARQARGRAARHRRGALSPSSSVPQAAARRQAHARAGPGMGAEPLLLPGDDSHQGRPCAGAAADVGAAPRMAPAHHRPRRRRSRHAAASNAG